ncbi:MAG: Ig-like domain-containing protein [Peptococcia bacterium]|jgi:hypothetical protein
MTNRCLILSLIVSFFTFLFLPYAPIAEAAATNPLALQINEELVPGDKANHLTVTGVFANGAKQQVTEGLIWTSSDTDIATVNAAGTVRFTGRGGFVTIAVRKGEASAAKTIAVKPWVKSLDIETQLVYSTNPYRLLAKGRFSDGTERYFGAEDDVTWSTSNPWVAWVNSQGVVTFTGEEGSVTIKAVAGAFHDEVKERVDTEKEATAWRKGIKIKEEIAYSAEKQALTLCAIMTDDSEEVIANESADWYSSNPDVARINRAGEITFTGQAGITTIKVIYGGYTYETIVKVDRFLSKVAINQSLNYTPAWVGIKIPLSVTATYNDGTEIIQSSGLNWTVSDSKIATISADGQLTFTGESGTLTVTASGQGLGSTVVADSLTVEVPVMEKPVPKRLYIMHNPLNDKNKDGLFQSEVLCIYSNGERRDVTGHVTWRSLTPDTVTVYDQAVYLSPAPGRLELMAGFQGITETISGYTNGVPGYNNGRIYQLRIIQHRVPFSFSPVQLTALAIQGDGSTRDVTAQLIWRSSQAQVVTVNKGLVTFTGRIGTAVITAQGFGLRDTLEIEVCPEDLLPRVERLVIEGTLQTGANQLRAVAYYNNGVSKDVTNEAVWNTSNKNVAVVSKQGTVMFINGLAPVKISACYGGKEGQVSR